MTTRRRLAILGALLAALLGFAGQQAATADTDARRRRTWGCVYVDRVDVEVCLDDPINLGPSGLAR